MSVRQVVFPCTPWAVDGAKDERMQPIPGTWTLAPEALCRQGIKGVICCVNRTCKESALIRFDMGEVDNGVLRLENFECRACKLVINARLLQWDRRKLFCVVYEILKDEGLTVIPRKEYMHAIDRGEAIMMFAAGTGYQLDHVQKVTWRMVDTGLAIGYFGQESDKDQTKLSVD
jgi:hypothetical protein